MNISKKAEYALKAVIAISRNKQNEPIRIGEISSNESIPSKFLEQILLNLKNNGILNSKRGANGGYFLAKSSHEISVGMILNIIDGAFNPARLQSGNDLSVGLEKCFNEMIEMINDHLNKYTIKDIIEMENVKDPIAFDI